MTNILVECSEKTASVQIGVLNLLAHLVKEGKIEVRFLCTRNLNKDALLWCDIYICVRGFERIHVELAKMAKRAGCFLVYFLDDDLIDIPADIPSADFLLQCNAKRNIQSI